MNEMFFFHSGALKKIEHYCAYQERCHDEVVQKLRTMKMDADEIDTIIKLIQDNFLNESRCMQFC
jgi:regulatory protein